MGIDLKAAKKLLTRLVHLGRPTQDISFLWELSEEIHRAVDFLLTLDRFKHLAFRFAELPNPQATRLHYALADLEESVMTDACEPLQAIPHCHINAWMCDGAILRVAECNVQLVRDELELVGNRHGVSFTCAPFY